MLDVIDNARNTSGESLGAIPIGEVIENIVGTGTYSRTRPDGYTKLVMKVEAGSFRLRPGDASAKTITAIDEETSTLTVVDHRYSNGAGPIRLATTGEFPMGLDVNTEFYVSVIDDNTIKLSLTEENALGGDTIEFIDAGSGTISIALSVTTPSSNVSTTGSIMLVPSDGIVVFAAPAMVTLVGASSESIVTIWWLP